MEINFNYCSNDVNLLAIDDTIILTIAAPKFFTCAINNAICNLYRQVIQEEVGNCLLKKVVINNKEYTDNFQNIDASELNYFRLVFMKK